MDVPWEPHDPIFDTQIFIWQKYLGRHYFDRVYGRQVVYFRVGSVAVSPLCKLPRVASNSNVWLCVSLFVHAYCKCPHNAKPSHKAFNLLVLTFQWGIIKHKKYTQGLCYRELGKYNRPWDSITGKRVFKCGETSEKINQHIGANQRENKIFISVTFTSIPKHTQLWKIL